MGKKKIAAAAKGLAVSKPQTRSQIRQNKKGVSGLLQSAILNHLQNKKHRRQGQISTATPLGSQSTMQCLWPSTGVALYNARSKRRRAGLLSQTAQESHEVGNDKRRVVQSCPLIGGDAASCVRAQDSAASLRG